MTAAHEEYLFALRSLCGESVTESSQDLHAVSFAIRGELRRTLSCDTVHDAQGIFFVILPGRYLMGRGQQSAAVLRIDADELPGFCACRQLRSDPHVKNSGCDLFLRKHGCCDFLFHFVILFYSIYK